MKWVESFANTFSHWKEPVYQDTRAPGTHFLAFVLYLAGMCLFTVYAIYDFVTYEPSSLFSSLPTSTQAPVSLKVEIDCLDCRPFYGRQGFGFGELFILKWDYTHLPSGCAAGVPETTDTRALRDFCTKQNDPTQGSYTKIEGAFCPAFIAPDPPTPPSSYLGAPTFEDSVEECQALCDANTACKQFVYNPYGDATGTPADGILFHKMCFLLNTRSCYPTPQGPFPFTDTYIKAAVPTDDDYVTDPNPLPAGADPMDRCQISSLDSALFTRSPSEESGADSTTPTSPAFGANPNYGKGSKFTITAPTPLCFLGDQNTDAEKGISLEVVNIPHHSFADPFEIGKVIVEVGSDDGGFKQRNEFQTWHKNTLHVGMHVERDSNEEVTSVDPYFFNFQYDGRTSWGVEESIVEEGYASLKSNLKVIDGLTSWEAWAIDVALLNNAITEAEARDLNSTNIDAFIASLPSKGVYPEFVSEIQRQTGLSAEAIQVMIAEHEATKSGGRRKLLQHDEWGGVEYKIQLTRQANVYTKGPSPKWYDVGASIGGASGTLIGLLAGLVIIAEGWKGIRGDSKIAGQHDIEEATTTAVVK
ncbi:hypothetical protein TrVE_jg9784 [Triparma verrucosa]|uniref:Uncharacterized protein n=1 Tax=Triparma verrucosa TaxID=1606542 RepID=A0A9W7B308_9STRA|nr:hypothetical protein TrVE_jg9784 [Triparma verrucosa]